MPTLTKARSRNDISLIVCASAPIDNGIKSKLKDNFFYTHCFDLQNLPIPLSKKQLEVSKWTITYTLKVLCVTSDLLTVSRQSVDQRPFECRHLSIRRVSRHIHSLFPMKIQKVTDGVK